MDIYHSCVAIILSFLALGAAKNNAAENGGNSFSNLKMLIDILDSKLKMLAVQQGTMEESTTHLQHNFRLQAVQLGNMRVLNSELKNMIEEEEKKMVEKTKDSEEWSSDGGSYSGDMLWGDVIEEIDVEKIEASSIELEQISSELKSKNLKVKASIDVDEFNSEKIRLMGSMDKKYSRKADDLLTEDDSDNESSGDNSVNTFEEENTKDSSEDTWKITIETVEDNDFSVERTEEKFIAEFDNDVRQLEMNLLDILSAGFLKKKSYKSDKTVTDEVEMKRNIMGHSSAESQDSVKNTGLNEKHRFQRIKHRNHNKS